MHNHHAMKKVKTWVFKSNVKLFLNSYHFHSLILKNNLQFRWYFMSFRKISTSVQLLLGRKTIKLPTMTVEVTCFNKNVVVGETFSQMPKYDFKQNGENKQNVFKITSNHSVFNINNFVI